MLNAHYDSTDAGSTKCCTSCTSTSTADREVLHRLLQELDVTMREKNILLARFHQIFEHIEQHFRTIKCSYSNSKMFIVTASVVNPALLSIMSSTNEDTYTSLFWLVWSLQIVASLVTAYTTFFKWDKKYFMYMIYKQRVEQEIWMYLELTGPYSIVHPLNEAEVTLMHTTHQSKIKHFLMRLERMYKKLHESDFDIEATDERDSADGHDHRVRADPTNRDTLRHKLMEHKIDGLMRALRHASTEDERTSIQHNIDRLQALQEKNHMLEVQMLASPRVDMGVDIESQQKVDKDDGERYPR